MTSNEGAAAAGSSGSNSMSSKAQSNAGTNGAAATASSSSCPTDNSYEKPLASVESVRKTGHQMNSTANPADNDPLGKTTIGMRLPRDCSKIEYTIIKMRVFKDVKNIEIEAFCQAIILEAV